MRHLALGELGADRDPDHPAIVQDRRGQIGTTRAVDAIGPGEGVRVKFLPIEPRRFVADADGLQRHRRQHAPGRCRAHLVGKPAGVGEIPAEACLQAGHALGAKQETRA